MASAQFLHDHRDHRFYSLLNWLNSHPIKSMTIDLSTIQPINTDCGNRRYFRIAANFNDHFFNSSPSRNSKNDFAPSSTVLAVDAPYPEKTKEFVEVRRLLAASGAYVPEIFAFDDQQGWLLIEDLGSLSYLEKLSGSHPDHALPLFDDAIDVLLRWQLTSQKGLLPLYSEQLLRKEMQLFSDWYLPYTNYRSFFLNSEQVVTETLAKTVALLVSSALSQPQVFVHRDFMPRNLLVNQHNDRRHNPGIIDFQDAVYGPIAYDLVSLLRDAFISWTDEFELRCLRRYWENARNAGLPIDQNFDEFQRQFDWLGIQRHLKIIGLFVRLKIRDGKERYFQDIDRFLAYLIRICQRYTELYPLYELVAQFKDRKEDFVNAVEQAK